MVCDNFIMNLNLQNFDFDSKTQNMNQQEDE